MERPRLQLNREDFIRHRLLERDSSSFQRYRDLVIGEKASLARVLGYELLTTLLGPLPGALGLVLRKAFYPRLFRHVGKGVLFGRNMTIRHGANIIVGDGVVFDDDTVVDGRGAGESGLVFGNQVILNRGAQVKAKLGPISIGDRTSIGSFATIISQGGVSIGSDVSIAGGCFVSGGLDRIRGGGAERERFSEGPIVVGDRAHLGMGAIVLDHVTVGVDAVVQAGSVVVADVAPESVVIGVPARPWRAGRSQDPGESEPEQTDWRGAEDVQGVAGRVRAYLCSVALASAVEHLDDEESFLDAEILDSVQFIEFVQWIESEFAIEIDDEEVMPENFDSLSKVVAFVRGRIDTSAVPG